LANLSVVAQSRALFHPFAAFLAKITLAREGDILDEANVQDVAFGLACADFQRFLLAQALRQSLQTTALLTANEGQAAMLRASSVQSGYRPPVGYSSHG